MFEATISPVDAERVLSIFGPRDQHLRAIREAFGVSVVHRDGQIRISGEEPAVAKATTLLEQLKAIVDRTGKLESDEVTRAIDLAAGKTAAAKGGTIDIITAARRVMPRTPGQASYVEAIRRNDLTFSIGPAGSGKTYLAVALAVEALKQKKIRKIVLVRPAVEAAARCLARNARSRINQTLHGAGYH